MGNCKNCNRETQPGQPICDGCVNNWLVMRGIIQDRLKAQYGPATRETLPSQQREMSRLENTWKRDREQFKKEVKVWYANV